MKGYEGWALRDRSFLMAVGVSLLWHLFWFFSIVIVVAPSKRPEKARPFVVSLGPVIDDTIFRTLVENKPQLSETFYRHLSDFTVPMEVEVQTIERHSPGDVVSVPFGRKVSDHLRELVGGEKPAPETELTSRLRIRYPEEGSAPSPSPSPKEGSESELGSLWRK